MSAEKKSDCVNESLSLENVEITQPRSKARIIAEAAGKGLGSMAFFGAGLYCAEQLVDNYDEKGRRKDDARNWKSYAKSGACGVGYCASIFGTILTAASATCDVIEGVTPRPKKEKDSKKS